MTVSAVVWAPQWTATWSRLSDAWRKRSAARLRSSTRRRIPSPAVPSASIPSSPEEHEEVDELAERVVVQRAAVLGQRCDRRSQRAVERGHGAPSRGTVRRGGRYPPGARLRTLRLLDASRSNGTRNIVAVFSTRSSSTVNVFADMAETIGSRIVGALKIERDGHLLRVTLARPERRNAFDAALIAELAEAFGNVGDARAVLLDGEGPAFCAGADVEWQRAAIDLSYDENVEDAMRLYRMLETVDWCPAPVVCCVHGFALGGGSGLVACADVAVAWPDAVFGFTEVRLGIIPAVISPFVLGKIGSAARRYFVTGERFDPGGGAPDRARLRGLGGRR